MREGYTATLTEGQDIYIPMWPANVQFENLTQVCKHIGQDQVVEISTNLNVPAAMLAVMGSGDAEASTKLMLHFVQQARIDGKKIDIISMDDLGMAVIIELFVHVLYSQYNDFFVSGLAKVPSLQK